jgi:hypothetical protein
MVREQKDVLADVGDSQNTRLLELLVLAGIAMMVDGDASLLHKSASFNSEAMRPILRDGAQ